MDSSDLLDMWLRNHKKDNAAAINAVKARMNKSLNLMSSIVEKAHETCCSYLTNLADIIVLPDLKSQEIAQRASKHVSEMLMSLAHGRFRELLKRRCANSGVKLELFKEPYSTQVRWCCSLVLIKISHSTFN